MIFYAEPLLEFPGLSFVRISVLLFYKKIFVKEWFQRICIGLSVVVALWVLAGFIVSCASRVLLLHLLT